MGKRLEDSAAKNTKPLRSVRALLWQGDCGVCSETVRGSPRSIADASLPICQDGCDEGGKLRADCASVAARPAHCATLSLTIHLWGHTEPVAGLRIKHKTGIFRRATPLGSNRASTTKSRAFFVVIH